MALGSNTRKIIDFFLYQVQEIYETKSKLVIA